MMDILKLAEEAKRAGKKPVPMCELEAGTGSIRDRFVNAADVQKGRPDS